MQLIECPAFSLDRTVEFGNFPGKRGNGCLSGLQVLSGTLEFVRVVRKNRGLRFGIRVMHGAAQRAGRTVDKLGALVAETFHQRTHGGGLLHRFQSNSERFRQFELRLVALAVGGKVGFQFEQMLLFGVDLTRFFFFCF